MEQTPAERIADALDKIRAAPPTLWRVDVGGISVLVHGEHGYDYLRKINQKLAMSKMALHKIAGSHGDARQVAAQVIEDMKRLEDRG